MILKAVVKNNISQQLFITGENMKKKQLILIGLIGLLFIFFFSFNVQKQSTVKNVKEFTAFFDVPGNIIDDNNEIRELIAEKTGAVCQETWLTGQTADEAIVSYIASGEYPDFISGNVTLYDANALIPIDKYWDKYDNIRNYLTEEEWELLRQPDGHIYWIPQFGVVGEESTELIHEGEAFWMQTRVLKWAGYPEVKTIRDYFSLIEAYMEANPEMEDGTKNIPFTILCDDWRYFCLENPPMFLAGYANDGSCIVDANTLEVIDYNVIPEAKEYFSILNEEYQKSMIDAESFTQTYEEYLTKLSTGRVLGMVDQWWQFYYDTYGALELKGEGYNYVPLPITINENVENKWHVKRGSEISFGSGLSVTVSCDDIEGALQFVNDLLNEEISILRFWGIKGVDYEVDEQGNFYLTEEQRKRSKSYEYQVSHLCDYPYFPRVEGMLSDGINAFSSEYQETEFYASLPKDVQECLNVYGCKNYVDMIGTNEKPGVWYPMYSYSDTLTAETEPGSVMNKLNEVKKKYLPRVIMATNFDEMWSLYMLEYELCKPELFFNDLQRELDERIASMN